MQTFMPFPSFEKSMQILDFKRLGNQRRESTQIYKIITKEIYSKQYNNHPAVNMWRTYENALALYTNTCIQEWINRKYKNNMPFLPIYGEIIMPDWIGNKEFHLSHQSNLLRKKPEYYSKYFDVPNNLNYYWPTKFAITQRNKI